MLLQFKGGSCVRPMEFSPCSRFLAIFIQGRDEGTDGIHIFDEELATLLTGPEDPIRWLSRDSFHFAWTPSSICVIINSFETLGVDGQYTHSLEAAWQAHEPHDGRGDVSAPVHALLAEFGPGETLQHFSCSHVAGFAAVTQTPGIGHPNLKHKLYVLQPGQPITSMVLAETHSDRFLWGHAAWSSRDQHLLMCSDINIQLVTSGCKVVKAYSRPCGSQGAFAAVFHPGGRHMAVFFGECTLHICRVMTGAVVLCMEGGLHYKNQLSFSFQGHQLRIFGCKVHVISFGQDSGGCREACHAIVSACCSMPMEDY